MNPNPWSRAWPAPAKLNLYLHITGVREDGMHWIQTQFQLLDLCDHMDFRVRADGQIRLLSASPDADTNADLTVRAAALLQQLSACPLGVDMMLQKNIPAGGGLGGGSSDAATTLMALNRLWGLNLELDRLSLIALNLGSDVPLFIHGHNARAEGIGDILSRCEGIPQEFLVLDPGVSVSTAAIYAAPELTRDTPRAKIGELTYAEGHNDCEAVSCALYPEVGRALAWLRERADGRMTGTGGCLYAGFETAAAAEEVHSALPSPWRAYRAQGIAVSPLLKRVQPV